MMIQHSGRVATVRRLFEADAGFELASFSPSCVGIYYRYN